MRASRLLRVVGLVIAVAAVVLAVVPFRASIPIHGAAFASSLRASCGPPVREAFHSEPTRHLMFSAANPEAPHGVGCVRPSRQRLAVSAVSLVLALLFVLAARFIDRRPPPEARRRIAPAG